MSSINFEPITLERIVARGNMNKAFKKVVSNKGGAGVDDMQTIELASYIKMHPYEITKSVLEGKYRPQPIKRVYIPKDNGRKLPRDMRKSRRGVNLHHCLESMHILLTDTGECQGLR